MGRIYSQAERVVVWLGHECDESASTAQAAIEVIFNACMALEMRWKETAKDKASLRYILDQFTESERDFLVKTTDFDKVESIYEGMSLGWHFYRCVPLPTGLDGPVWAALKLLFDRTWFRRTWCVQEIRLSKGAVCYWGHQELSWSHIGITAAWLEDHHARHDFAPGTFPVEVDYYSAIQMYDTEWDKQSLLDTLKRYRGSLATDPRDKVYGLLNLVEEGSLRESIVIDYRKPAKRVYADTALQIIRAESNLNVLAYVEHYPNYTGENDTYSWAPRWDVDDRAMALINYTTMHDKAVETLGPLQLDPDNLQLEGLPFGQVTSVDVLLDDVLMKDRATVGSTNPFLDLWNKVMCPDVASIDSFDPIIAMFCMARTLTASDGFIDTDSTSDDGLRQYANYLSMMDHLFHITGQTNMTPYEPLSMAVHEGDRFRYEDIMWRVCDQRRIIWLNNGSYGLGPACIREGDFVVILAGGQTPYAIRATPHGHIFLGAVYIQEVVNDELIENIRDGNHKLQEYRFI